MMLLETTDVTPDMSTWGTKPQETTPRLVEWTDDNKVRNVVIGFTLIIVNALTLVTVVRTKSLRTHTKLLIGSLTCTDMLMGLSTLLPRLLPWHELSHEPLCLVRYVGVCMAVYGSCMSVIAITIDRMLALTFPIIYRTSVSVLKSALAVVTAWGSSAVLTAASLVGGFPEGSSCTMVVALPESGLLVMGCGILASVLAVAGLYVYIGLKLRKRFRRVRVMRVATTSLGVSGSVTSAAAAAGGGGGPHPGAGGSTCGGGGGGCTNASVFPSAARTSLSGTASALALTGGGGADAGAGGSGGGGGGAGDDARSGGGNSQIMSIRMEKRATLTALMLAVCFLVGYLPISVYLLWLVFSGVDLLEEAKTQRLLILIAFPLVNCILDPIVYFWRLQPWNSDLFRLCRKVTTRRENLVVFNTTTSTGIPHNQAG